MRGDLSASSVEVGEMPTVLAKALERQSLQRREAFLTHLTNGTSADYLSDWLARAGTPVSATTLKLYRRSLHE